MTTTNDNATAAVQPTDEEVIRVLPALLARLKRERQEEESRKRATRAERDLLDRLKDADEMICVYANNGGPERLPGVAEALYSASTHLIQSDDPTDKRVGYILALDALLVSPGVIESAVRTLRQRLATGTPSLGLLGVTPAPPLEHTPLAVNHTIDDVIFELRPDGELLVQSTALGLVRIEPGETYALHMFMRSPAVVALLEAQHAARMTEDELSFQDDQAAEAVRLAESR